MPVPRFRSRACFTLAGLTLCASGALAQQVDLTPRLEPGTDHRFKVESRSSITRSIPDLDQNLSQTTDLVFYMTRRIDSAEGDSIDAKLVFDRIVFRTQEPNLIGELEDVEYDTGLRDPESGERRGRSTLAQTEFVAMQYAEIFEPLIGNAIEIRLDSSGRILDVHIPETVGDASLFSTEMIKDRFLPLFQVHPEGGQHEVGAEWKQTSSQDSGLGFDIVSDIEWRLIGLQENRARIGVRNSFSVGKVERDTGMGLRESSGDGEVIWNTQLGILDELISSQSIQMGGRPPEVGGAEISLSVRSRIRISRHAEPWPVPEGDPNGERDAPQH
ncbi:MAG: hypothetical protein ACNA8P_08230 [Phycisphaerales bacterium]